MLKVLSVMPQAEEPVFKKAEGVACTTELKNFSCSTLVVADSDDETIMNNAICANFLFIQQSKPTCCGWVSLEHANDTLAVEARASEQQRLGFGMPPGDDGNSRVPVAPGESSNTVVRYVIRHHQHSRVAVKQLDALKKESVLQLV